MKKMLYSLFGAFLIMSCNTSQETVATQTETTVKTDSVKLNTNHKPKLIVGIVVDQMRADYISRFWEKYGENGFKRLINYGFHLKNNHFNYVPTYTGPGHASVYTGTTPRNHGIIANNWFDKSIGESVYCAGDNAVNPVGTNNKAGKMSPSRMKTTTFADQNRLHTQFRGKTIGIALKDRGAILPAGHTANAAYWFYGEDEGNFISSSFYQEGLPEWVQNFNQSGKAASYLKEWNTLYPIENYTESGNDINSYEFGFDGKEDATFPYDLAELKTENDNFDILKATPYGNNLTTDFAIAAIKGERLGKDKFTDVLTLSYSSTDYVGHNFGVNSKEVQDTYLRLDQDIARLLDTLDQEVGKWNYTVFLTADHGGVNVPNFLKDHKIPAGYFSNSTLRKELNKFLGNNYAATNLVANVSNNQVFFDYNALGEKNIKAKDLEAEIANFLLQQEGIYQVYTRSNMQNAGFTEKRAKLIQNGFNQKRSGDVVYVLDPAHVSYPSKGSTHGSALNYDTHVPLIFYGNGIKKGKTYRESHITDIAPTISALLEIAFPNNATGVVLYEILKTTD